MMDDIQTEGINALPEMNSGQSSIPGKEKGNDIALTKLPTVEVGESTTQPVDGQQITVFLRRWRLQAVNLAYSRLALAPSDC